MIEVFANGKCFPYWTGAQIARSLDHFAATFSLTLAGVDVDNRVVKMFPGDSVQIAVDGVTVVDGYVRKVASMFGNGSHSVTVSGCEKSCDIVDCCVESPIEWENKKIDSIIGDICAAYDLTFANDLGVDVGKAIPKFSVETGTKALDTIAKLCKMRGVLPCSNGLGRVYLLDPDKCDRGIALEEGKNIISASAEYSVENRFSKYTVLGCGKAKSKIQACSEDSQIDRNRPLVIVDSNATEKDTAMTRANWENSTRAAKSIAVNCAVSGWTAGGSIWAPGVLCSFCSPQLGFDTSMDLLVAGVTYTFGGGGSVTNLRLVAPDSFEPAPNTEKPKKAGKTKTSDMWAGIKKAVKG